MKIKTLNDFNELWVAKPLLFAKDRLEIIAELRQEAIKVIKYYLELLKNKKPTGIDYKDQFINGSRNGAIAVMVAFFNITDEDLK